MAFSTSQTLSQALLAIAVSHHSSNVSSNRLSLSVVSIPTFSCLKSQELCSSTTLSTSWASRRRMSHSRAAVRAAVVETLDSTAETLLVEKSVNTIRFLAIDVVEKANSSHDGLPMRCAPMGHILYEVMMYNPKNPY